MKKKEIWLGAHINFQGSYLKTVKKIKTIGGNVVSLFIGSPKQLRLEDLNEDEVEKVRKFISENNIQLVTHAKYLHNFSRPYEGKQKFFVKVYSSELDNTYRLGGFGSVLHFGKSVDMTMEDALQNMYENIIMVINKVFHVGTSSHKRKHLKILLETSSGQGTEILTKVPEIAEFYKRFSSHQRKYIRFCIDTCHIFAAGYDIRTEEGAKDFLLLWEKSIGLEKISLIHLNDSETPLNSHRDKHAPIGSGFITNKKLDGSIEGIKLIVNVAAKMGIPMIIERGTNATKAELNKIRKLIV